MSQQNVEILRHAVDASRRGERWADVLATDFEWDHSAFPGLDMQVRGSGRENYLQMMDRYRRAWIDYEMAVKELIDAGDDVVVTVHEKVRARGTEMLVERDLALVWTLREGRAIRVRGYGTKHEALEAAGLRE